jgi:hypothetical protein
MGCENSCSASIMRSKVTRLTMVSRRYLTCRIRKDEGGEREEKRREERRDEEMR